MTDKPPSHLSKAMKQFWAQTVSAFELEPHHLLLLAQACQAWDRAEEARRALKRHGLTTGAPGSARARPEIAVERDSRLAFARLLRELDLDFSGDPSRSPALRSNRR